MAQFRPVHRVILAAVLALSAAPLVRAEIVYEVRSKYQRITVVDTPNGMRQMIFDAKMDGTDAIQSEMNKRKPLDLTLSYAQGMITSLPLVKEDPSRILVVGLGGACLQRYMHELLPHTIIESAELDPDVLKVAKQYFNFVEDDRQKCAIADGREYIEKTKEKYDLIMLDAFSADSIPYGLSTQEFLQLVKSRLADGGMVAANLWYDEKDYNNLVKTYAAVFPEIHVVRCPRSSNQILVAFPTKRDVTPEKWIELATAFEKTHPTGMDLPKILDHGVETTTRIPADAKVLTDREVWKQH